MSLPPAHLKISHITHIDNLSSIIAEGGLVSDAIMMDRGGPPPAIGMSNIKRRRLRLPVSCHSGDFVGNYVPFYFCPRSVMLYVIHCANHPELTYRGGQTPIVHLEADLHAVVGWAEAANRRWAFSLSNAAAVYAEFRASVADLEQIDWDAVLTTDFRTAEVKERKQAEFLVRDFFPWTLVTRIGVISNGIRSRVQQTLKETTYRPVVEVQPNWYY